MSVKVNLPPGCSGVDCKDGTKYTATRPGGSIMVEDRHANAINTGQFGEKGLVSAKGAESFGTKRGQRCAPCNRTWNAWNKSCPKCGCETESV
jgi:hypothetical protein